MKWQEFVGRDFFSENFLEQSLEEQKVLLIDAIGRRSCFFSLSGVFTESLLAILLDHEFSQQFSFEYFDHVFDLAPFLSSIDLAEIEKTRNRCLVEADKIFDRQQWKRELLDAQKKRDEQWMEIQRLKEERGLLSVDGKPKEKELLDKKIQEKIKISEPLQNRIDELEGYELQEIERIAEALLNGSSLEGSSTGSSLAAESVLSHGRHGEEKDKGKEVVEEGPQGQANTSPKKNKKNKGHAGTTRAHLRDREDEEALKEAERFNAERLKQIAEAARAAEQEKAQNLALKRADIEAKVKAAQKQSAEQLASNQRPVSSASGQPANPVMPPSASSGWFQPGFLLSGAGSSSGATASSFTAAPLNSLAPVSSTRDEDLAAVKGFLRQDEFQTALKGCELYSSDPSFHILRALALAGLGRHKEAILEFYPSDKSDRHRHAGVP